MLNEINEFYEQSNQSGILVFEPTTHMKKSEHQAIEIRGVMKLNEPMMKHTSWRTGGHAERYFKPADNDCCDQYSHQPTNQIVGVYRMAMFIKTVVCISIHCQYRLHNKMLIILTNWSLISLTLIHQNLCPLALQT